MFRETDTINPYQSSYRSGQPVYLLHQTRSDRAQQSERERETYISLSGISAGLHICLLEQATRTIRLPHLSHGLIMVQIGIKSYKQICFLVVE